MKKSTFNLSAIPIFLVFLAMGFGDAAGQLVSIIEKAFNVTPFVASFVSFSGMIMFGVLSVPMGIVQSRIGKKKTLLLGLAFFILGASLPIISFSFTMILLSVLLMGTGATILQVSGNPIMRDVSEEGNYSSNLSFAQSLKAIGTLSTSLILYLIGIKIINYQFSIQTATEVVNADFRLLFPVFATILIITFCLVLFLKITEKNTQTSPTTLKSCIKTLRNPYILMMFFAIFFYCGAEASMFNRIPNLLESVSNVTPAMGNIVLIVSLFVGRFLGGVVLRFMKPINFLFITIVISILGNAFVFMNHSVLIWASFILIGFGFANIFPLIFSIAIDKMPEKTNEISGLMVTAIVGAAFVPLLTGAVADIKPIFAFLVPLCCLIYLGFVATKNRV